MCKKTFSPISISKFEWKSNLMVFNQVHALSLLNSNSHFYPVEQNPSLSWRWWWERNTDKEICPSYLTHIGGGRGGRGDLTKKIGLFQWNFIATAPQPTDKEIGGSYPSSTKSVEAEWSKIACWTFSKIVCWTSQNCVGKILDIFCLEPTTD